MSIVCFCLLLMSAAAVSPEELFEAAVGRTVTIPCRRDQESDTVYWNHIPFGGMLAKLVYYNEIFPAYRDRYTVTESSNGDFNLTIRGVSLGDSGKFTCTTGQQNTVHSFELVVLELCPSPQSCASNSSGITIIGRNSCRIEPDIVALNCTLRYQGNFQPVLEWSSTTGNSLSSTLMSVDYRTTVSTFLLNAGEQKQNNATYSCNVKYINASLVSRFYHELPVNIITIMNETHEYNPECNTTHVQCCSDTANECSYNWTDNKSVKISSYRSLSLHGLHVGQYVCTAECFIRKKHVCTLVPAKVNVTCDSNDKQSNMDGGTIAAIVIGVTVAMAAVVCLVAYLCRRHGKKKSLKPIQEAEPLSAGIMLKVALPKSAIGLPENVTVEGEDECLKADRMETPGNKVEESMVELAPLKRTSVNSFEGENKCLTADTMDTSEMGNSATAMTSSVPVPSLDERGGQLMEGHRAVGNTLGRRTEEKSSRPVST